MTQPSQFTEPSLCFPRLVNNAGIGLVGPLESIPIEEMKKVFETNFFGVIRMIKEVMPDMKRRKGGHIIVVSSVMGLQGGRRPLPQAALKNAGKNCIVTSSDEIESKIKPLSL